VTSEPTTAPADDLALIKAVLREIIINQSNGHDGHTRLEAIKLLHQLIANP
jgi:hypothetical protein